MFCETEPNYFDYKVLKDSAVSSAMIMFIVAAAGAFGFVMTKAGIPVKMSNWIISLSNNKGF